MCLSRAEEMNAIARHVYAYLKRAVGMTAQHSGHSPALHVGQQQILVYQATAKKIGVS